MGDYTLAVSSLFVDFDGGGLGGVLGEFVGAVDFGVGALTDEVGLGECAGAFTPLFLHFYSSIYFI